jgi:hypothetical protein
MLCDPKYDICYKLRNSSRSNVLQILSVANEVNPLYIKTQTGVNVQNAIGPMHSNTTNKHRFPAINTHYGHDNKAAINIKRTFQIRIQIHS